MDDEATAKALRVMRWRRRGLLFAVTSFVLGVVGWLLGLAFPEVIAEVAVAFFVAVVSLAVTIAYFAHE